MKVLKFGGSSVASPERIKHILSILSPRVYTGEKLTLVFSAFGGVTDQLIKTVEEASVGNEAYLTSLADCKKRHFEAIAELFEGQALSNIEENIKALFAKLDNILNGVFLLKEVSDRSYDYVMSFGERLSNTIIAHYFSAQKMTAEYLDARKVMVTNSDFRSAAIYKEETYENIVRHFKNKEAIQVVTGFIASDKNGKTTTLGRGGSDYTASILAAALDAEVLEIWTDVDGVLTSNPKIVSKAFPIPSLSYNEAMELSHFGAKVIYPPTIQPVLLKEIPLFIRNTFNPDYIGTKIERETQIENNFGSIKGLSSLSEVSLVTVSGTGIQGVPGTAARIFNALAKNKINVILITQASSEHSICFAVLESKASLAEEVINQEFEIEINKNIIQKANIENNISVLAVVGEAMKEQPGIAGKIFSALGRNGVNIEAIAQGSSELNISFAVKSKDEKKALNLIHDSFFKNASKTLNLFVVGTGLIGSTLLDQIKIFSQNLINDKGLEIKIIALSNSRKMLFNENGIDLDDWKNDLNNSEQKADPQSFIKKMIALNLANSVFVDNTASDIFPNLYKEILSNNISISTPNKVSSSGSYEEYQELRRIAKAKNIKLLIETNVGAGLPVISTIETLRNSGDKVTKIEAVLSGSISYIFNNYNKDMSFHDIVKDAQSKGLTEPDPRDDLSGLDVMRKITILAREAGYKINMDDITLDPILPEVCLSAESVDDFYKTLISEESYFNNKIQTADSKNQRLRFIASFENGKASVALKALEETSPFYNLSASDNMIAIYTERYTESPLVIRGPGAGADVTAAGVFSEIIQISTEVFSF